MHFRIAAEGVETRLVEANSMEDAVREFNACNGIVRTFKQCRVESSDIPFELPAPEPPHVPEAMPVPAEVEQTEA